MIGPVRKAKAFAFLLAVIGSGMIALSISLGSLGWGLLLVPLGVLILLLAWVVATNGIQGG